MTGYKEQFYLNQELDLSVKIIKSGFALLQNDDPVSPNYFLISLVLSTGLERYMKVILHLLEYDRTGKFLSEKTVQYEYRHNLEIMKNDIIKLGYTDKMNNIPINKADKDFLNNDRLLNKTINVLSDFARKDRYIYMDGVTKPDQKFTLYLELWADMIEMAIGKIDNLETISDDAFRSLLRSAHNQVIACIERFLRASVRTLILSEINQTSKGLASAAFDFLALKNDELGEKLYQVNQTLA